MVKRNGAVLFLLLGVSVCRADGNSNADKNGVQDFFPYSQSSMFVRAPSRSVGAVLAVPSTIIAGALVCPFIMLKSDHPKYGECAFGGGFVGFYIGTAVVGAPFYAMEKVFWDLPRSAFSNSNEQIQARSGTVRNGRIIWDEKHKQ